MKIDSRGPAAFEARLRLPAFTGVCLAAVSGGADSTAMLTALAARRAAGGAADGGLSLWCMHVDHGLRGKEAESDACFVSDMCRRLNVPFTLARIAPGVIHADAAKTGVGIEAAARKARYALLTEEAARRGAGLIATAHTRDDMLETVLLRLLRGAGPAGLSPLRRRHGILCRPMLDLSRTEVLRYLEQKKAAFRVDSSNRDCAYTRNRLRLRLIPVLNDHFPGWKTALGELAETQDRVARHLWEQARAVLVPKDEGRAVSIPRFGGLSPILQEEALFCAMDSLPPRPAPSVLAPDLPAEKERVPRRKALRRWIESEGRGACAGAFYLTREADGSAVVRHKEDDGAPEEWALVLKTREKAVVFSRSCP